MPRVAAVSSRSSSTTAVPLDVSCTPRNSQSTEQTAKLRSKVPVLTVGDSDGARLMEGDGVGDGVAPLPLPLLLEDFEVLDFLLLDFFDLAVLLVLSFDLADFLAIDFSDFLAFPVELFFLAAFKIRSLSGWLSTKSVFAR